jgi:hypothetical protein
VIQAVEHLPSKHEALSSSPSTTENKSKVKINCYHTTQPMWEQRCDHGALLEGKRVPTVLKTIPLKLTNILLRNIK